MATKTKTSKRDIYQEVTDKILTALDEGTIPWRRPWVTSYGENVHRNFASKKPYRGINPFLLDLVAASEGYQYPLWLTFKQAKAKGGQVRKGEKGTLVVFWKMFPLEETDSETGETKKRQIPFLRYYTVFNVEQCDGLKLPDLTKATDEEFNPIDQAKEIIDGMPQRPPIRHGGDRAFYHPIEDRVQLPKPEGFSAPAFYYSTSFHELAHSTGHEDRLARPEITKEKNVVRGDNDYSQEELTAEMTAAMLSAIAGISMETIENAASYVDHWRKKISEDPKLVVHAAARAQKAADFILNEEAS